MRPNPGEVFLHRYGGIYIVATVATRTTDLTEEVVYQHWWPFENKTWLRPIGEWTPERFTPLTVDEAAEIMDRETVEAARARITAAKAAKKQ